MRPVPRSTRKPSASLPLQPRSGLVGKTVVEAELPPDDKEACGNLVRRFGYELFHTGVVDQGVELHRQRLSVVNCDPVDCDGFSERDDVRFCCGDRQTRETHRGQ
jgi:hypothetical protein